MLLALIKLPGTGGKHHSKQGAEGALSDLTLKDKHGEVIEKQLPGGKVKKKAKNEIILETNTRSRKKCVTTILGAISTAHSFALHILLLPISNSDVLRP